MQQNEEDLLCQLFLYYGKLKAVGWGVFFFFFFRMFKKIFITGSSAESCGGYGAAAGLHIALIILQNYKNSYLKQRLTNEI